MFKRTGPKEFGHGRQGIELSSEKWKYYIVFKSPGSSHYLAGSPGDFTCGLWSVLLHKMERSKVPLNLAGCDPIPHLSMHSVRHGSHPTFSIHYY